MIASSSGAGMSKYVIVLCIIVAMTYLSNEWIDVKALYDFSIPSSSCSINNTEFHNQQVADTTNTTDGPSYLSPSNDKTISPPPPPSSIHSLHTLALRGEIHHDQSPCGLAKWRMSNARLSRRMFLCPVDYLNNENMLTSPQVLRDFDTVFVWERDMENFYDNYLQHPNLTAHSLVVLTQHEPAFEFREATNRVLDHDRVLYMASQNPWKVHAKLGLLPQGVGRVLEGKHAPVEYRIRLVQQLHDDISRQKTKGVFLSWLSRTTNPKRTSIPSGTRKMNSQEYFEEMAKSKWVISPDGDRPDCKRHWEAIGLGTVPITQLSKEFYGPFIQGAILDFQGPWNVTYIENNFEYHPPNRAQIFEEYWMQFIEYAVGRQLSWRREEWREWIAM